MHWSPTMSLSFRYSNQNPENISSPPIQGIYAEQQYANLKDRVCDDHTNAVKLLPTSWEFRPPGMPNCVIGQVVPDVQSITLLSQTSTPNMILLWLPDVEDRQHSFEIMEITHPVTQHSILEIFNIRQYHRVNFNSRNVLYLEIYWKILIVLIYISGMSLHKETRYNFKLIIINLMNYLAQTLQISYT